ncbi:MerR family transcriptional regulator (plasmid) [Ectopseudomonas oleovorans]|nr:MerR family transcriptional regulator [Pseudomonas oleovorans]
MLALRTVTYCTENEGTPSCPLIASLQGGASLAGSAMP